LHSVPGVDGLGANVWPGQDSLDESESFGGCFHWLLEIGEEGLVVIERS
jgi:hypothetical protein